MRYAGTRFGDNERGEELYAFLRSTNLAEIPRAYLFAFGWQLDSDCRLVPRTYSQLKTNNFVGRSPYSQMEGPRCAKR
jgi:hypothetical protein